MNSFQDPTVIVAFAGVVVALISSLLSVSVSRRTQRLAEFLEVSKSSLEFKKQQLDELYGPLFALDMQNKILAQKIRDIEGENFLLLDSLPEILTKNEVGPIVKLLTKNNEKIEHIILTKSSLIEGDEFHSSFILFLKHFGLLKSAIEGNPLAEYQPDDYLPKDFGTDIQKKYGQLRNDVENILRERSRLLPKSKKTFFRR